MTKYLKVLKPRLILIKIRKIRQNRQTFTRLLRIIPLITIVALCVARTRDWERVSSRCKRKSSGRQISTSLTIMVTTLPAPFQKRIPQYPTIKTPKRPKLETDVKETSPSITHSTCPTMSSKGSRLSWPPWSQLSTSWMIVKVARVGYRWISLRRRPNWTCRVSRLLWGRGSSRWRRRRESIRPIKPLPTALTS